MVKFNDNQKKLVLFAYELSEKRLESQLSAALASDQRSTSFAGVVLAAAAILTALSSAAHFPIAMLIGAGFLAFSAAIAGYAARPIIFFMPGARSEVLKTDIKDDLDYYASLLELAGHNDTNSKANDTNLKHNGSAMRVAFVVAIFGVLVAVAPEVHNAHEELSITDAERTDGTQEN